MSLRGELENLVVREGRNVELCLDYRNFVDFGDNVALEGEPLRQRLR